MKTHNAVRIKPFALPLQNPWSTPNQIRRKLYRKPNILQLPNEILEIILSNLNISAKKNFEATCPRIRTMSLEYYKHKVNAITADIMAKKTDSNQVNNVIIFSTINRIAGTYLLFGTGTFFYKSMAKFLQTIKKRKCRAPTTQQVIVFLRNLLKFYDHIQPTENYSKILFAITTIHLLKYFRHVQCASVKIDQQTLSISISVQGIWFALLWSADCMSLKMPGDQQKFLIMLAVLLINDQKLKNYYKIWDCDDKVLVFGNNYKKRRQSNQIRALMTVQLNISGNEEIIKFFETFLSTSEVSKIPSKSFSIRIRIVSNEASKWGCDRSNKVYFSANSVVNITSNE